MINTKTLLSLALTLVGWTLIGQNSSASGSELDRQNDTWITPVISDEMTINPEQTRQWRLGQNKFPARPKDMWEIGIHYGHFMIDGDVDRKLPAGYGTGIHFRKAINYVLSLRFDFFYGQSKGLETQPWRHRNYGGGLVENIFDAYNTNVTENQFWFPSHKT